MMQNFPGGLILWNILELIDQSHEAMGVARPGPPHYRKTNQWGDVRSVEKGYIMKPFCQRGNISRNGPVVL